MSVTLYSTHCPQCTMLARQLDGKEIQYDEVTDREVLVAKGFSHVPMLEVDGTIMNLKEAVKWVGEQNA